MSTWRRACKRAGGELGTAAGAGARHVTCAGRAVARRTCCRRRWTPRRSPLPGAACRAGRVAGSQSLGDHQFRDRRVWAWEGPLMATAAAATKAFEAAAQATLAEELRQAEEDFANGDFIDITIEELDRCILAGEWPWQDEPSA